MFELIIALKPENLKKAKIPEKLVEWGGELFSYDPPRYVYHDCLVFDEFHDKSYFQMYYGSFIKDDVDMDQYRAFWLTGNGLWEMERQVNNKCADIVYNELFRFLSDLSKLNDFVVFLIRDEEEIDMKYKLNHSDELIPVFCSCLQRDAPKGALIIKLAHSV